MDVHWPPGAEIHSLFLVGYPRWVALRAGITSLRHIGAESSHSNKVVIRRLSYLDLFSSAHSFLIAFGWRLARFFELFFDFDLGNNMLF